MSLDTRLELLQAVLGKDVRLVEPKKEMEVWLESRAVKEHTVEPSLDDQSQSGSGFEFVPHVLQSTEADETQKRERALRREQAFENSGFRPGEPLDSEACFCPLKAMLKYPETFIGKANKPRAKPFFTKILLDRTWDFFYLHDADQPLRDPYLLVPTAQFEVFLDDVNIELGIYLKIPEGGNEDKFSMRFGQGGAPRPRYLRRSEDESSLDIRPWPKINQDDIDGFSSATEHMKDDWRAKMKLVKTGFVGKKGNSEKSARKKRDRQQMLLDTQAYLGLRGSPPAQDAVFVCVDIEAIERHPNPISEIGFAILDTKDIKGISPGQLGENWWMLIRGYHLRVWEYSGLRNSQYVQGCPDAFDFGTSTFLKNDDVQRDIASILAPYTDKSRNIVLLGHDIAQDIKYMSSIGISLLSLNNLAGQVDTKDIFQAWRDEANARGLGKILADLGISHKNLHNAGNDAHYTMCAMLGVALEQIREHKAKLEEKMEITAEQR